MFFLEQDTSYIFTDDTELKNSIQESIYSYESDTRDIIMEGIYMEVIQVDGKDLKAKAKELITRMVNFIKDMAAKLVVLIKNTINNATTLTKLLMAKNLSVEVEGLFVADNTPLVVNAQQLVQFIAKTPQALNKALSDFSRGVADSPAVTELEELKKSILEFKATVKPSDKVYKVDFSTAASNITKLSNTGRTMGAAIEKFNRDAQLQANKLNGELNKEGSDAQAKIKQLNKIVSVGNSINGTLMGMFNSVIADGKKLNRATKKQKKQEAKADKKAAKQAKKENKINTSKRAGLFRRKKGWSKQ